MRGPRSIKPAWNALESKTKFGFFLDWAQQETRCFIVLFMIFLVTEKQQAPFWRTIINVLLCGCILLHEHLLCFDEHPKLSSVTLWVTCCGSFWPYSYLCEHMAGDRQRMGVVRCLWLAITKMPRAFTVSVQLCLNSRICLSPFVLT